MLWAFITVSSVTSALFGAHQVSPVRRAFRAANARWKRALEPLREVFGYREDQKRRLDEKVKRYEAEWRRRVLEATEVEALRDFGAASRIPWSTLREAGFDTVEKLRAAGPSAWSEIHGVGDQSIDSLSSALATFESDLADRRAPLPPQDLIHPSEIEVLQEADSLLAMNQLIAPQEAQAKKAADRVEFELERLREQSSFLSWINPFGRRERRRIHEQEDASFAEVAPELESALHEVEGLRDQIRRMVPSARPRDELQEDYRRRNADFVSLLEPYFIAPGLASRGQGLFSEDLLQRIEAQELQLEGLNVTLRGYQDFGAKFIVVQGRILIGDEMGLGKTIQALAALTHLRNAESSRRFLVVCPPSIIENWSREIEQRSDFKPLVLRGPDRSARTESWLEEGGLALTSFETLRSGDILEAMKTDGGALDMLVADEAHLVKNPDAGRTLAFRQAADFSTRVCLMTGTPIENKIDEFGRIISHFSDEYAAKLAAAQDAGINAVVGREKFMSMVAPVYLRRNQEDVLKELPEKIEKEEWVRLSPTDEAAYRKAVMARDFMAMRRSASLGDGTTPSAKLERLAELVTEYRIENRKILIFSFFLDVLNAIHERFPKARVISGSVTPKNRQSMMDAFQSSDDFEILACQIGVGAVGLNLQAASVVVIVEPQWKPSTETQAIARAHRMGQTRSVMVHRLLAEDSVDERMTLILADKQATFDTYVRDSALKESSHAATETGMVKEIIAAEIDRLGA